MTQVKAALRLIGELAHEARRWLTPAVLAAAYVATLLPIAKWFSVAAGALLLTVTIALAARHITQWRYLDDGPEPIAILTRDAVGVVGDELDDWAGLYGQWDQTCKRAGIKTTPPINVYPGELAACGTGPDGPILLAGPQLLDMPSRVRTHALAHEAAHLIAGHHTSGYDVRLAQEAIPAIAYLVGLLTAGFGLLVNDADLRAFGLASVVVGAAIELAAAAWSRDREHTADAIAAHCLGRTLDPDDIAAMVADDPSSAYSSIWDSHPGWQERHDSMESHRDQLGDHAHAESAKR